MLLGIKNCFPQTRKQTYFLADIMKALYPHWYSLEYRGQTEVNSNVCLDVTFNLSVQIIGSLASSQPDLHADRRRDP